MIIRFPKQKPQLLFLENAKLLLIGAIPLLVFCYLFIDRPIAEYFSSTSPLTKQSAEKLTQLISPGPNLIVWPLLFFLLKYGIKKEQWSKRCLSIAIAIPLSALIVDFLKPLVGRARPIEWITNHLYGFTLFSSSNAFYSFPSGHACTIGAICGAFSTFYPRYSIPFVIAAFLLALTRVVLVEHYLSDIIAGLIIGLILSQWTSKIMKSG